MTADACARQGLRVLVLEEGDWVEPGTLEPYSQDQMRRQYRNGGLTVALGRPPIAYTEGRCAGGGSEVNSGLYHRPGADLLAEWSSRYAVDALDEATLAPHHAEVERRLAVGPTETEPRGPPPRCCATGPRASAGPRTTCRAGRPKTPPPVFPSAGR